MERCHAAEGQTNQHDDEDKAKSGGPLFSKAYRKGCGSCDLEDGHELIGPGSSPPSVSLPCPSTLLAAGRDETTQTREREDEWTTAEVPCTRCPFPLLWG